MDLRNIEYSILGQYLVIDGSREVYAEDGKLLGKLPKNNMTEEDIASFFNKKKEKDAPSK